MEIKNCPYCGEEILAVAKKCKHCGEWLGEEKEIEKSEEKIQEENINIVYTSPKEENVQEENEDVYTLPTLGDRISGFLFFCGICWVLFHFGGWHLLIGEKISAIQQLVKVRWAYVSSDFLFDYSGIAFRIHQNYYGFAKDTHYFDLPFIQWIMLILSLGAFYWAYRSLFGSYLIKNKK
jgi:hypothetical protein